MHMSTCGILLKLYTTVAFLLVLRPIRLPHRIEVWFIRFLVVDLEVRLVFLYDTLFLLSLRSNCSYWMELWVVSDTYCWSFSDSIMERAKQCYWSLWKVECSSGFEVAEMAQSWRPFKQLFRWMIWGRGVVNCCCYGRWNAHSAQLAPTPMIHFWI